MKRSKIFITLFTLMLCMGLFSIPAFASAEPEAERLTISTAWTDGDTLHIEVRDNETGTASAIELRLSDYAENAETITIQAVDADGNNSAVITITNPYYIAPSTEDETPAATAPADSESAVPDESGAFTPDGTGSVQDNVTEQNGKEFFTIITEAGNEFFLIVDRQKTGDNVYLLNAVTEDDLMALAKKGDGTTESAVPDTSTPAQTDPSPEPSPEPEIEDSGGSGNGSIIFIVLAVAAAGGAGYYFKIVKPKRQAPELDEYDPDYEDEPEGPEDEDYEREDDAE